MKDSSITIPVSKQCDYNSGTYQDLKDATHYAFYMEGHQFPVVFVLGDTDGGNIKGVTIGHHSDGIEIESEISMPKGMVPTDTVTLEYDEIVHKFLKECNFY